jgi:biotin synthase-related radical SAM superfamily protein
MKDIATFGCDCGNEAAYDKARCKGVPMCKNCNKPMPEINEGPQRERIIKRFLSIDEALP